MCYEEMTCAHQFARQVPFPFILSAGDTLHFFMDQLRNPHSRNDLSIVLGLHPMVPPLPNLSATDFRGRGILHVMIQRNASDPSQPCLGVSEDNRYATVRTVPKV